MPSAAGRGGGRESAGPRRARGLSFAILSRIWRRSLSICDLAGAAEKADAAALAFEVGPRPDEPARLVGRGGRVRPGATPRASSPARRRSRGSGRAVDDLGVQGLFEVALLDRRQRAVDDDDLDVVRGDRVPWRRSIWPLPNSVDAVGLADANDFASGRHSGRSPRRARPPPPVARRRRGPPWRSRAVASRAPSRSGMTTSVARAEADTALRIETGLRLRRVAARDKSRFSVHHLGPTFATGVRPVATHLLLEIFVSPGCDVMDGVTHRRRRRPSRRRTTGSARRA